MRPPPTGFPVLMGLALGGPLLLCALLYPARDSVSDTNAVLLLVLLVVGVAAAGRRAAGLVAALSSAVWFDFFLTQPYLTLTIRDRDDVETAVLLTLVGVAVTEIALWGIRQRARASGRAGYLDGLVSAAAMAADGDVPPAGLVDFVGRQITDVLGLDSCTYRSGAPAGHPCLHTDGTVTHDGREIDVDRAGLPTWDVVELAVPSAGAVVGTFVLTSASRRRWPSLEQRLVAVTLAEQVGSALVRPSAPPA
ncbi:DUF4118 domain-containing protein [Nocardioides rubriscoriae]|uniref:DUF4118 domain-containing protein n=1 Tax=Nocardioides rubriscoriae TaxID=642762 RepID=UPI0011E02B93|nr:DUF4118 domain-containing protein [Nocardioides rubriscoriae]